MLRDLQTYPPAKLAYGGRDMSDWLEWWRLGPGDFTFTSHFPLRTVTAQRVAILVGDDLCYGDRRLLRAGAGMY